MVRLSIVIPVFNGEKQIGQAIECVLSQSMRDLELICVDDCSTDDTAAVIERYAAKDARVRLVRHAVNRGTLMARKTGVDAACGKYLMHMDADDTYAADALQILCDEMDRTGADMIYCGTEYLVDEGFRADPAAAALMERDGQGEGAWTGLVSGVELLDPFFISQTLHWAPWNRICTLEVTRRAFAAFDNERILMCEDVLMTFLTMVHASRVGYLPQKLYVYHYGGGITSKISVSKAQAIAAEYRVYQLIDGALTEMQKADPKIQAALAAVHDLLMDAVAWNLLHIQDTQAAAALMRTLSGFAGAEELLGEVRGYYLRSEAPKEQALRGEIDRLTTLAEQEHEIWCSNEARYQRDIAQLQAYTQNLEQAAAAEHESWAANEARYQQDIAQLQAYTKKLEQDAAAEHEVWAANEAHYQQDIGELKTAIDGLREQLRQAQAAYEQERRKNPVEHMKSQLAAMKEDRAAK